MLANQEVAHRFEHAFNPRHAFAQARNLLTDVANSPAQSFIHTPVQAYDSHPNSKNRPEFCAHDPVSLIRGIFMHWELYRIVTFFLAIPSMIYYHIVTITHGGITNDSESTWQEPP